MGNKKNNTGHRSTGNYSTGDCSTGNWSTGDCSTGYRSTGYRSTGNCSTGYRSTGNWSTGDCSTGNWSTGNYSTGDCSTGNWSTGNWSISKYSSGHFSTIDCDGFGAFNKKCTIKEWENAIKPNFIYFSLTKWVSEDNMTDEEKINHKEFHTTKGYLKVLSYQEAWSSAWNSATEEDKELLFKLPNFDSEVFKEISGIDVNNDSNELTIEQLEKLTGIKNLKIKK